MVYNSATPYHCLVDTLPFLLTFFGHCMILLAILYSMQHTNVLTIAILYSMQHTNVLTMSSLYRFSLGLNFAC